MARRGGLGAAYSKWDKFEEDDPLARLRVTDAPRRHPALPQIVRKRPEAPRRARKGPATITRHRRPQAAAAPRAHVANPAATPLETPLAPLKEQYAIEFICDPN